MVPANPIPYATWPATKRDIIYAAANISTSTTWHHVSVPFTTSSVYKNIAFTPQSTANYTELFLDSISIIAQPPAAPVISGQWDLLWHTASNITTSDTIKNWNPAYTYSWYIGKNGSQQQFTTNPFTVNWTGHTGGGMLYVQVMNDSTYACAVDSFKVFGCCDKSYPSPYIIADTTFSSNTTITNSPYLNGQIIINANVIIGGQEEQPALWGRIQKLLLTLVNTLTINHGIKHQAYCDTMWMVFIFAEILAHLRDSAGATIEQAKICCSFN